MKGNTASLFELLESGATGQAAIQERLTLIIKSKKYQEILQAALAVRDKYPDASDRNVRLSILRTRMRRACRALQTAPLTIVAVGEHYKVEPVPKSRQRAAAKPRKGKAPDLKSAIALVIARIQARDATVIAQLSAALVQGVAETTEEIRKAA